MQIAIDDRRLLPIRGKVEAGERLSFEDGVTLYRTTDILSLGYLANLVRERLHGAVTYFNVNRHINPTDVCVASCRLCAFGKRVRDPKAYTMSLEEVWHKARLMLDNIPHIKAYWVMMTPRIAQIALRFGADDIDGTIVEERIYHDAGATTSQGMRRAELLQLIRKAGREPVERDTLYRPVQRAESTFTVLV
jgi:2-iminoacetate synthase ThiH